ncbi:phage tail fiber protein [Brevundimonas diminuta]|uniref:phage tail fiber domain-containing protein n=1 Tax=Brevundimonas diminuta TaxID=293 RepID=UPI001F5A9209|nr:phage tail fiber protein [Brevundimonas diminuta]
MHNTKYQYVVENGQREFDLAVNYLDRSHITVTVNGARAYVDWVNDSRFRLRNTAPDGAVVLVRRQTPIDQALVEFQNGSNLTKEELNRAVWQLLFRMQEQDDTVTSALDQAVIRVGENLGISTDPTQIVNELLWASELGDDLLNRFRGALSDIDLNAERIIDTTLSLTNQAFRLDNLTAVVDALANLEDGSGLATIIQNEAQQRTDGDAALASTLALIGAKSSDNTAFILDLNKTKASPTETMAQRFNAIYAANANALSLIQTEQNARVTALEAFTQTLATQASRIGANEAAIANEVTTRTNAISSEAAARQALSAKIANDIAAAVLVETNARAAADLAESQARQSLATTVGQNTSAIQNEATARSTLAGSIAQQFAVLGAFRNGQAAFVLDLNRVEVGAGFSLGTRLSGIDVAVGNAAAAVVEERTARINGDNALSQSLQTVQNTVGGNTASITQLFQVTNGINARWTMSLNSNGHITGITANNNGQYGTLAFVADEVSYVAPNGGTPIKVMSVVANKVRFNSNVEIYGDLLVTGTINNAKLTDNTVTGVEAGYNPQTVGLNNSTPTRIHGVWINVEKAKSPIDIAFNSWATFTHNASGSFVATVQLVRSRGGDGGTVIQSFNITGSGMANDTWQGAVPVMYLDRPNETGNWHYYVQIFFNVGNMSTQSVTARYGKVIEMKNNTSSIGVGTGSGAGVGSGGGSGGGGGGGGGGGDGGGGLYPNDPGTDQPVIT